MNHQWLEDLSDKELKEWFTNCPIPLLRGKLNGEILGCNPSFEREFGWNSVEFQSGHANWKDMTPVDSELVDDQLLAQEVAKGERSEYHFFKKYRRKDGVLRDVRIHVMRRPSQSPIPLTKEGDIEFFVTVTPIDTSFSMVTEALTDFSVALHSTSNKLTETSNKLSDIKEIIKLQTSLIEQQASWWKVIRAGWNDFLNWGKENKLVFTIIILAILFRIVGSDAFKSAVEAVNPFHKTPAQLSPRTPLTPNNPSLKENNKGTHDLYQDFWLQ